MSGIGPNPIHMPDDHGGRRRIHGVAAIEAALARGEALRLILVDARRSAGEFERLRATARAAGVPLRALAARHFERIAPLGGPSDAVALAGAPTTGDEVEILRRPGAAWLLVDVAYPGNAGFAIRTAEVAGAAGVFLDTGFDHAQRREALRASMRADRYLPVRWVDRTALLARARAAGRRVIAIEDVGDQTPWEVDLTGSVLFVVGGEATGIPARILAESDAVVKLPMAGFIRSYNLQAALAMVVGERLRQTAGEPGGGRRR